MAKGSQLSQLKTALADAGLSRSSQTPAKKRKRDALAAQNKATSLKEITDKLNPFDLKVTRLKHDVGGRKVKGKEGKPALKNQAGIEQRKESLLGEIAQRNRSGAIIDRRFGENDPTMTPEERMLERFTKERQKISKASTFNLEDDEELTHYGQSLSNFDDFDGIGLGGDDDDDDLGSNGQIDAETVTREHFGGFEDGEDGVEAREQPPRKKTKAEVMSEVIAKSKEYKYLHQLEKEKEDGIRRELDDDFEDIRNLLESSTVRQDRPPLPAPRPNVDPTYDTIVRELAFEARSKPKDRTKTEEEIAAETKTKLEKAERQRLRRMQGLDEEESDEGRRAKRSKTEKAGGDDLDAGQNLDGMDLDGLGAGLQEESASVFGDTDSESDESEPQEQDGLDPSSESDESDDQHSQFSEKQRPGPSKSRPDTHSEELSLPFVFPCPGSHEEWLEIVQDVDQPDIATVIQRIVALHHPSLGRDNKEKLQIFNDVLIDHVLHVTSGNEPDFEVVEILTPFIYQLSKNYPDHSAGAFVQKLSIMEKNLARGAKDPEASTSKTWPGYSELALLRLVGIVWSTSDMKHRVVGPARLLMGAYLELGRIRNLKDLASGLFLCTLWLQFEALSKRLVPEQINFLLSCLLILAPTSFTEASTLPFTLFSLDFAKSAGRFTLREPSKSLSPSAPDLTSLLRGGDSPSEQTKVDLLSLTLKLLALGSELHKGLHGFIELYQPVLTVMSSVKQDKLCISLASEFQAAAKAISNLIKFAKQARRPLLLQEHKPVAIVTYAPKISMTGSSYLRAKDPDHERAAASKLRREYKQEKKGALKELRKDAKFLAQYQQEKQAEKDKSYNLTMRRALGSIEGERAEQKKAHNSKIREKRRSGKK